MWDKSLICQDNRPYRPSPKAPRLSGFVSSNVCFLSGVGFSILTVSCTCDASLITSLRFLEASLSCVREWQHHTWFVMCIHFESPHLGSYSSKTTQYYMLQDSSRLFDAHTYFNWCFAAAQIDTDRGLMQVNSYLFCCVSKICQQFGKHTRTSGCFYKMVGQKLVTETNK